ncbi:hypothetical protein LCGC14_1032180 [marine sediment metagenome]|uniref:Uncharacterized protein n=1 Tax=marine sediment metagenome TaxID=412755 RepID=A0A0F9MU94_9ZZZZ
MSKAVSYYDWQLTFKNKSKNVDKNLNNAFFNSLGISDTNFKDFMKNWKEKNFIKKT